MRYLGLQLYLMMKTKKANPNKHCNSSTYHGKDHINNMQCSMFKISFISISILVLFSQVLTSITATACTRSHQSIDKIAAIADVIFMGRVESIDPNGILKVRTEEQLKGDVPTNVKLKGFHTELNRFYSFCGIEVASVNQKYYFFALQKKVGQDLYLAANSSDALVRVNDENKTDVVSAIKNKSHSSEWRLNQSIGVSARLVTHKTNFNVGENISFDIILLNLSNERLEFNYRTWPPNEHSYCDLLISSVKGTVEPRAVPIDRSKIEKYFSEHGHSYQKVLDSDSLMRFGVGPINTAKPGYGYKEKLNFSYYPLQPGTYEIAASCVNFFGSTVKTNSISVEIKQLS